MADGFAQDAQASEGLLFDGQYSPVRVLTYNIKGAEGGDGRNAGPDRDYLALDRIVSLVESHAPQLVALQEIAVFGKSGRVADQIAHLAKRLGMYHAFGPVEGASRLYGGEIQGYDYWGNAVLSRYPIESFRCHELCAGRPFDSRSALETRVSVNGTPLTFLSVHLSYVWRTTFGQCRELANLAAATDGPVIVAGDFNAFAGSAELSPIHAVMTDTFSRLGVGYGACARYSFPDGPGCERDLDHIFVSKEVRVASSGVCVDETRSSDHNPVCADLLLPVASTSGRPDQQLADDLLT
jgi:endonuclease/exonuclease/phosphatase family metal-dependent hydrolase